MGHRRPGRAATRSWGRALFAGAAAALLMPAVATAGGVTVVLGPTVGPDDVQILTLDGQRIGTSGPKTASFSLGELEPDARIGIEATNSASGFSWNFAVTKLAGGRRTTLISEQHRGGSSASTVPTRIGTVRRVVVNPSGAVLESCGETGRRACAPVVRFLGSAINGGKLHFQYRYRLEEPGFERFRLYRDGRLIAWYSGRAPKARFEEQFTITLPLGPRTRNEVHSARRRGEPVAFTLRIYVRDDAGKVLGRSVRLLPRILG